MAPLPVEYRSDENAMKNVVICCVLSAIFGAAIAAWLVQDGPAVWPGSASVHAQNVLPPPGTGEEFANDGIFTAADQPASTTVSSTVLAGSASPPISPVLTQEEQTNIRVYDGASRGVVNIVTRTISHDRFFMFPVPGEGAGSGSVIDKRGHILTNNHVIEGAQTIQVTLPNGTDYSAEVVGTDAAQDVAVLKIDAPADELFPIPIGTSDNLRVGQRVYALGNPFGLEGTLTTGIISNLNRTLPSRVDGAEMKSIIQTDAAMNPGNSGGPLLDTSGRMIGMNVAIATRSGQSAGLGFAIPVNRIRKIIPELVQYGKVVRADIGIVAVAETDRGLQIVQTNRGGAAEKAGLRGWKIVQRRVMRGPLAYNVKQKDPTAADVIIAVDGQPVTKASAFVEVIEEHKPGDRVVLTILREGDTIQVPVILGSS
jgi:S1-C subfamily serine protease